MRRPSRLGLTIALLAATTSTPALASGPNESAGANALARPPIEQQLQFDYTRPQRPHGGGAQGPHRPRPPQGPVHANFACGDSRITLAKALRHAPAGSVIRISGSGPACAGPLPQIDRPLFIDGGGTAVIQDLDGSGCLAVTGAGARVWIAGVTFIGARTSRQACISVTGAHVDLEGVEIQSSSPALQATDASVTLTDSAIRTTYADAAVIAVRTDLAVTRSLIGTTRDGLRLSLTPAQRVTLFRTTFLGEGLGATAVTLEGTPGRVAGPVAPAGAARATFEDVAIANFTRGIAAVGAVRLRADGGAICRIQGNAIETAALSAEITRVAIGGTAAGIYAAPGAGGSELIASRNTIFLSGAGVVAAEGVTGEARNNTIYYSGSSSTCVQGGDSGSFSRRANACTDEAPPPGVVAACNW